MRIIVTAGGTGGHIYPALSIIKHFKKVDENCEVLYIGTHNRMENDIIPNEGISYESIEIYGFSKTNMTRNFKNIFLIKKAIKKCENIIKDFKPDVVLGIGGYVTYPVIKAAKKLKVKTFLHEQNAIPGKTNKALAKYADIIGVSFKESIKYFDSKNVVYTGNPCGQNALMVEPIDKTKEGFDKNKKLVIVVAGSLGSYTINETMKTFIPTVEDKKYELLYITGKEHFESFDVKIPANVKVLPYYNNLSALMKSADLVVTRAGASTISEILALQLPAIFIPSPYVANNHQYYNAIELKNTAAAEMIEEANLTNELLQEKIEELLFDDSKSSIIKDNLKKLNIDNSNDIIYKTIKEVLK